MVLDASPVIALLDEEPGHEQVAAAVPRVVLSAVNLAEVVSKLAKDGVPAPVPRGAIASLGARVVPFDADDAELAGAFRPLTAGAGLSLGDWACLALARRLGLVALTTEHRWASVADAVDVRVRNIRPVQR